MQLGMIGLGRMGNGMTERLRDHGHHVATYDPNVEARTAASLQELKSQLDAPRTFWMMVPAGEITEAVFQDLLELADEGDTIVDGGNANFRDSQRRYREAQTKGLHFVDAGVSGGIWGLEIGFCLMVGGDDEPVQRLEPILESLSPEDGYAHVGASGAGTFSLIASVIVQRPSPESSTYGAMSSSFPPCSSNAACSSSSSHERTTDP